MINLAPLSPTNPPKIISISQTSRLNWNNQIPIDRIFRTVLFRRPPKWSVLFPTIQASLMSVRLRRIGRRNIPSRIISIILRSGIWAGVDGHLIGNGICCTEIPNLPRKATTTLELWRIATVPLSPRSWAHPIHRPSQSLRRARRNLLSKKFWTRWKRSLVRRFEVICPKKFLMSRPVQWRMMRY